MNLLETVIQAYTIPFRKFNTLSIVILPWLALGWVFMIVGVIVWHDLGLLFGSLVNLVAMLMFSVRWHRALLLDEVGFAMRPTGNDFRFLGWLVLFMIAIGLAGYAFQQIGTLGYQKWANPALNLAILFFLPRFALVFPATAIGRRDLGPLGSWRLTRGWTLLLGIGFVLCQAPGRLLTPWVTELTFGVFFEGHFWGGALLFVFLLWGFVLAAIAVTFLSLVYQTLAGPKKPVE